MRILEERESHLENEMISLQEEFNAKLQKQKVGLHLLNTMENFINKNGEGLVQI